MRTIDQVADFLLSRGRGILVLDGYLDRCMTPPRTSADFAEVALTAWGLGSHLSGVLLEQQAFDRSDPLRRLVAWLPAGQDMVAGVRMDPTPARARAGGRRTPAVADVRRTLADHREAGAAFAEWRAHVDLAQVARGGVHVDAPALALSAAASQSEGLLPVVTVAMPDLATHSLAVTEAVTTNALRALFAELERYDVQLGAMIVRVSMVVAGERHPRRTTPGEAADATLRVLAEHVPPEVAGVAFLSGGQRVGKAAANLSAIAAEARHRGLPHRLTFAFGRALAESAARTWAGGSGNLPVVQRELVQSCRTAAQALMPSLSGDAASA